jgi:predicted DNA-binding transcriptional regulator YafY
MADLLKLEVTCCHFLAAGRGRLALMSRASRLLDLLQLLRRHRYPVPGAILAEDLGISLRSLYRDINTLRAQGAHIEGETGIGYVLRPGLMLPPLMFTPEEMEALLLGSKLVAQRADTKLVGAAENAFAKIREVLPPDIAEKIDGSGLLVGRGKTAEPTEMFDLAVIREALRKERKLKMFYLDANGKQTQRIVWPVALLFLDQVRMLAAWCETRADFRHFRVDRISKLTLLEERPPQRRISLMKEWRKRESLHDMH